MTKVQSRCDKDWIAAASVAAVLRAEDGVGAVDGAYETIVKNAFAMKESGTPIARHQVHSLVAECIFTYLPAVVIDEAVVRLVQAQVLQSSFQDNVENLTIDDAVYRDIQQAREDRILLRRRVFDAWLESEIVLEPGLVAYHVDLEQIVEDYIGRVIGFLAQEALADWGTSETAPTLEPPTLDKNILTVRPELVQKSGVAACRRFFTQADEERRRYLEALVDGYYELQLLRCTQEIQDVFTAQLADTECYLDTNILIDLLGIADGEGQTLLARQAIAMSVESGVKVRVSEETRREYIGLLDEAESQRKHDRRPASVGTEHPDKSRNASVFLLGYYNTLAKDRTLTWGEYRQKYENLPSLLKPYQVEYCPDAIIQQRDQIEQVANIFDACWKTKRAKARIHDAAMYLLIKEYRLQRGTGIRTWFLTRDFSLSVFDHEAKRSLLALDFPTPSFAIRPYSWIEWLRSRTPGRTAPGIVHLLCDLTFTRPQRDYRVIARKIEYMETYRDLDADLIQSIDSARIIDDEFAKFGKSPADVTDEEMDALVDKAVLRRANQMAEEGKIAKNKAASLTERVKELEASQSYERTERTRIQTRMTEVETTQQGLQGQNIDLRQQNERLQLQHTLTIVAIILGFACYAVIRIGKWWAFPMMLLPLVWWVGRHLLQKKGAEIIQRSSLIAVAPTLGAFFVVCIEMIVYPYLPVNWQSIARNEFLWIIASKMNGDRRYLLAYT